MTSTGSKSKPRSAAKATDWKGQAPNSGNEHGQWKSISEIGSVEKIGFAVVSVKLRPAEKSEFQALCKVLGVSPNWAMRSLVRQASGFLEVSSSSLNELQSISRQLNGVATNINQIAKAGNRTLSPDHQAFMEDRQVLGKELSRLQSQLQTILDVGRRRGDGLEQLKNMVRAT